MFMYDSEALSDPWAGFERRHREEPEPDESIHEDGLAAGWNSLSPKAKQNLRNLAHYEKWLRDVEYRRHNDLVYDNDLQEFVKRKGE